MELRAPPPGNTMKTAPRLTLAMLVPLLANGCFEVDDLKWVEAADASSDDAGERADASRDDAGELKVDDAGSTDARTEPAGPCTATSCAEGELCAPSGSCIARCDESGACVVASTNRVVSGIMADGPVLYVALAATSDRYGNVAPDAELHTLIGDGELTLLTALPENAESLESHGEYVYWRGTRPDTTSSKIRRISKHAVGGPEALYAGAKVLGNVLLSDTRLALHQADGIYVGSLDGATDLRKVQGCPAVTESWQDVCYPMAFSGDSLFYLHDDGPTLDTPSTLSAVDLATMERKDYGVAYHNTRFLAVEPPYIYLPGYPFSTAQVLYRRDLRDLTIPDFTFWLKGSPYYSYPSSHAIRLRGDWVYVLATETTSEGGASRNHVVFERMAAAGAVNVQSILPETFGGGRVDRFYVDYALTDTHAFVAVVQVAPTGTQSSLVYRVPLPR